MKSSHRAAYEKSGNGVLSHAETQRAQSGMAALVAAADLPFESPAFSALILASSSLTVPILPIFGNLAVATAKLELAQCLSCRRDWPYARDQSRLNAATPFKTTAYQCIGASAPFVDGHRD